MNYKDKILKREKCPHCNDVLRKDDIYMIEYHDIFQCPNCQTLILPDDMLDELD